MYVNLSRCSRAWRVLLKRFLYSMIYLREAAKIALGFSRPLVSFVVEGDPPPVYFNFRIRDDALDALADELCLPNGFKLSPLRCLEGEQDFYCLTLNVYRLSGITHGLRAEWSVFVSDDHRVPHYMVIEARASRMSMDPVNLITRASRVQHTRSGDRVETTVRSSDGGEFSAAFDVPTAGTAVRPSRQWASANDYIYWRNGVCDRVYYDSGIANAQMWLLAPDNDRVVIHDTTQWRRFVEPSPRHVFVCRRTMELSISPWFNLDLPQLPGTRRVRKAALDAAPRGHS